MEDDGGREHRKEKRKNSKNGSTRVKRLSRTLKNNSGGDEPGEDGGEQVVSLESSSSTSPTTKQLSMSKVRERALSGTKNRKRGATEGENGSLLSSFRKTLSPSAGGEMNSRELTLAQEEDEAEAEAEAEEQVEVDEEEEEEEEVDTAPKIIDKKSSKKKSSKPKKRHTLLRRKKNEDKILPVCSDDEDSTEENDSNNNNNDNNDNDDDELDSTQSTSLASSSSYEKRKQLKRSGSMVELKQKQITHIDRQSRSSSRDSVSGNPGLERIVSMKNLISYSDGGSRRVASTPEPTSPKGGKTMNPLWVLSQKAKVAAKSARVIGQGRVNDVLLPVDEEVPDRQRQRNRVINEIVNTERDYVQDLKVMLTVFRAPLEEEGILSREESATVFSNLSMLLHVNSELYEDLARQVRESSGDDLGRCFVTLGDYLRMYSQYCSNQSAARGVVMNATKANPRFRAFQEKMALNPDLNGLTLRDFLIKPIQRLCKYPLLIRELIKNTDVSHADYRHLQEAYEKIEAVVTSVNEKKLADEEREAFARIISRLSHTEKFGIQLMVPGRRFESEGKLVEVGPSKERTRRYFLFNDLLILVEDKERPVTLSRRGNKESLMSGAMADKQSKVVSMIPFAEASLMNADHHQQQHLITISHKKETTTLRFESKEERQEWMTSLTGKLQTIAKLSARSRTSMSTLDLETSSGSNISRGVPAPPSGPAVFSATPLSP